MDIHNDQKLKQEQRLIKVIVASVIFAGILGAVFFLIGNFGSAKKSKAAEKPQRYTISGSINSRNNLSVYERLVDGDTLYVEKILRVDGSLKDLYNRNVVIVLNNVEMQWGGEYALYLGEYSKIILINDGRLTDNGKNYGANAVVFFGETRYISCDGSDATYSFEDINKSGIAALHSAQVYSISGSISSKENAIIFESALTGDTLKLVKSLQIDNSFEGLIEKDIILLIDGAEMNWEGGYNLYLSRNSKIILKNDGKLVCNDESYGSDAAINFRDQKMASYNGKDAKYNFEEVNKSGVLTSEGISALPVTLIRFEGVIGKTNEVILKWSTASEINNDKFEIQRSSDMQSWIKIGTVKGNGNSSKQINYEFLDQIDLAIPTYYYRLNQFDYDGTNAFSPITSVKTTSKNRTIKGKVYPNPAIDVIKISYSEKSYQILIYDLNGKQFYQNKADNDFETIDCSSFPNGLYIVELKTNLGSETHKIKVQH